MLGQLAASSRFDDFGAGEYADEMDSERLQRVQRAGRRFGIVTFAIIVSAFVMVCSAQILYQGFRDRSHSTSDNCKAGVGRLISAVRLARQAAYSDDATERAALQRFRAALASEWQKWTAVEELCRNDDWSRKAIIAIDEWRWTEEIAVRYESADLAPSRRRVQAIEGRLGGTSPNR